MMKGIQMNFFANNTTAFARAIQMRDDDDLQAYLDTLVGACVFKNDTDALTAFEDAVKVHESKVVKMKQDAVIGKMQKALDAYSLPKTFIKLLDSIHDEMTNLDLPAAVMFQMTWKDNALSIERKVIDTRIKARGPRKGASGGKAMLDGQPLTAKLLRESYPGSFATKALANPHDADASRWGAKTRLNATQAVRADSALCGLLTFEG